MKILRVLRKLRNSARPFIDGFFRRFSETHKQFHYFEGKLPFMVWYVTQLCRLPPCRPISLLLLQVYFGTIYHLLRLTTVLVPDDYREVPLYSVGYITLREKWRLKIYPWVVSRVPVLGFITSFAIWWVHQWLESESQLNRTGVPDFYQFSTQFRYNSLFRARAIARVRDGVSFRKMLFRVLHHAKSVQQARKLSIRRRRRNWLRRTWRLNSWLTRHTHDKWVKSHDGLRMTTKLRRRVIRPTPRRKTHATPCPTKQPRRGRRRRWVLFFNRNYQVVFPSRYVRPTPQLTPAVELPRELVDYEWLSLDNVFPVDTEEPFVETIFSYFDDQQDDGVDFDTEYGHLDEVYGTNGYVNLEELQEGRWPHNRRDALHVLNFKNGARSTFPYYTAYNWYDPPPTEWGPSSNVVSFNPHDRIDRPTAVEDESFFGMGDGPSAVDSEDEPGWTNSDWHEVADWYFFAVQKRSKRSDQYQPDSMGSKFLLFSKSLFAPGLLHDPYVHTDQNQTAWWLYNWAPRDWRIWNGAKYIKADLTPFVERASFREVLEPHKWSGLKWFPAPGLSDRWQMLRLHFRRLTRRLLRDDPRRSGVDSRFVVRHGDHLHKEGLRVQLTPNQLRRYTFYRRGVPWSKIIQCEFNDDVRHEVGRKPGWPMWHAPRYQPVYLRNQQANHLHQKASTVSFGSSSAVSPGFGLVGLIAIGLVVIELLTSSWGWADSVGPAYSTASPRTPWSEWWHTVVKSPTHPHFGAVPSVNTLFPWVAEVVSITWAAAATIDTTLDTWEYVIGYLLYLDTPVYLFQWIWGYQFPLTIEHIVRSVWDDVTRPIDTVVFTAELIGSLLLRVGYYVISHFNVSIGSFNVGPIWSPTMTLPSVTFRIDWINHLVVAWNSFVAWGGSTDGSLFFPKVTTRQWRFQWSNLGGMHPLWFDWTPLIEQPVSLVHPRVNVSTAPELFRRQDFQKDGQVRRFFEFQPYVTIEDLSRQRTWSRAPGIGSNLFINNHVDNVFGQFELQNFKIGFADDDLILNLKMWRRTSEINHVFYWDAYQPPWSPVWAEFHYKVQDKTYGTAWLRRVRLGEAWWYERQFNYHWLDWEYFREYDYDRQVLLWLKHRICGVMIGRNAAVESHSWMQSASASAVYVDPRAVFSDRQNFHINWLALWGRICTTYNWPDDELIAMYKRHTLGHVDVTWALPRRFENSVDEFWLSNIPQLWETQIASNTLSMWRADAELVIRDRTVAYAPGDWLLSYVDDFGRRVNHGCFRVIDVVTSSRVTWWLVIPYGCSRLRTTWVTECSRDVVDVVVRNRPVRRRSAVATTLTTLHEADATAVAAHNQTEQLYRTGVSFVNEVDPSDSFNLTHQHNRENHQLRVHHAGGPTWTTKLVRGRGVHPVTHPTLATATVRHGWSRGLPALHGTYASWRFTSTASSSWLARPVWSITTTCVTDHDVRRGERDLEDITLDADPERENTRYWFDEVGRAPRWLHTESPIGWYARRQSTRDLEHTRDVVVPAVAWRSTTFAAAKSTQSDYHRLRYRSTARVTVGYSEMLPTVTSMYQVLQQVNYPGCHHHDDDEVSNGYDTEWYDDDEDVNILGYSGRENDENADEHAELDTVDEQYTDLVYVGFEPDQLVGVAHAELTNESEIARLLSAHRRGSLPDRIYQVSAPAEAYVWADHVATSLVWSSFTVDHPAFAGLTSTSYEVARYLRRTNITTDEVVRTAPTGLLRNGPAWSPTWLSYYTEVHDRRGTVVPTTAVSPTSLTAAIRSDTFDWYHGTTGMSLIDVDADAAWWDDTVTTPGRSSGGYVYDGVPGYLHHRFRPWITDHGRVWHHTGVNGSRELTGEDLRVNVKVEPETVWLGSTWWWESHDWWEWLLETDEQRDEYYDHPDDDNEDGDDGDVEVNPSRPIDFPDWIVDLALAGTSPGDRRGSAVRARFGTTNLSEPHDEIEVFRSKPFTMYLFHTRDEPPTVPEWTFTRPKGERSDRVDRYRWRALTKSELTRFDTTETKDLAEDYSLRQTKIKIWALTEVYYNDGPHGRIKWS